MISCSLGELGKAACGRNRHREGKVRITVSAMCVGSALEHRPSRARARVLRVAFPRVLPQQGRRQPLPRSLRARSRQAGAGVGLRAPQWHGTWRAELKARCRQFSVSRVSMPAFSHSLFYCLKGNLTPSK